MGWQDRDYSHEQRPTGGGLMWLLTGTVPLFTAFGVRVAAHASMIVYAVLVLLAGLGPGFTWQDRVGNITMLFAIVLLHEFGHVFAARRMGGTADEIIMHPLGGFALAAPPRRAWPHFVTAAGGPAVNVVLCIVCGGLLYALTGAFPWRPFFLGRAVDVGAFADVAFYVYWIYQVSWMLLLFNLLPIYPLDGGQMLQAALWPKLGYFRSMLVSCSIGMVGAALGAMIALATLRIGLGILAAFGFLYCYQLRQQLVAAGAEHFTEDEFDSSSAWQHEQPAPRRISRRKLRRLARQAAAEQAERARVDEILAKLSAKGFQSLTWSERRALHRATEHLRQRDTAERAAEE
jgi:Zn-dependent protease